jgi:autotransporter family porin
MKLALAVAIALASVAAAHADEIIEAGATVVVPGDHGSPWLIDGLLTIGRNGDGTLVVASGGSVQSNGGTIGSTGAAGQVSVSGAGSEWRMEAGFGSSGDLAVGASGGSGSLSIGAGATVSNETGRIGFGAGSFGVVEVTGAGSSWINRNGLTVGEQGTGVLSIADGAIVSSREGLLAVGAGSAADVQVSGAGSAWDIDGALAVGQNGDAALTIADGGVVSNGASATIGTVTGSAGDVAVSGAGSRWNIGAGLMIGNGGDGALRVADGGSVHSVGNATIANNRDSNAAVVVTGSGSLLEIGGGLVLGTLGNANMAILDGARVTTALASIGQGNGSRGRMEVGAGAVWDNLGDLSLGRSGEGVLTITDGGQVIVAEGAVRIARDAGSSGTLNIGAGIGEAAAAAGTLHAARIEFGDGDGSINFNHSSADYAFAAAMSGNGALQAHAGTTILSGDSSGFTGTSQIFGGALRVDGRLGGSVEVSGGRLEGIGTLMGPVVLGENGTIAPGQGDGRIGTLTLEGDLEVLGGTLWLDAVFGGDGSPADLLVVQGNTSGGGRVVVNQIGGSGAQTQDGIRLIQVDGISGAQFDLAGRAVGGAYEYFLFQGGKSDPSDGDWYLRSELKNPPVYPCPGKDCDPPPVPLPQPVPDPAPVLRPEVGAYLANQAAAVEMFRHTMHARLGEPNFAERLRRADELGSVWARTSRRQSDYRMQGDQLEIGSDNTLLQIGEDLVRWEERGRGQVGVMAASGRANNRVLSQATGYAAKGKVDGVAVGVYGSWYADPEQAQGFYLDGAFQYGRYKHRVEGVALQPERYDARSLSASFETGYAWRMFHGEKTSVFIEPQLQLLYTDYRGGEHAEGNGTVVNGVDAGGLATRLGLRIYGHGLGEHGNRVQPFVAVNWWSEGERNALSFDGLQLEGGPSRHRYEVQAGVQMQLGGGWTGWGQFGRGSGDSAYRSVDGQLGLRYGW